MKKSLPFLFLLLLLVLAFFFKWCNRYSTGSEGRRVEKTLGNLPASSNYNRNEIDSLVRVLRANTSEFYFTKHARCRMKCRHITQQEVREVVRQAKINLQKSEHQGVSGNKFALEGYSNGDSQHIRVIIAPYERRLTVVTVIDLDDSWECSSCKN
jgi:hypothetical protein